jgi:hypothetical protein
MIAFPPSLLAGGGSHTGLAPAHLLDVLDVNGNLYYFTDRGASAPIAITWSNQEPSPVTPPPPPVPIPPGHYIAWTYPTSSTLVQGSGSASASNVTMPVGGPFTNEASATLSDCPMPMLPNGAFVTDAIAVATISYSGYGAPLATGGFDTPYTTEFSGTFTRDLGWINDSTVTGATFYFALWYTLVPPGPGLFGNPLPTPDVLNFGGLAVAIYYTVPLTLPSGPPPPPVGYQASAPYLPWLLQVPSFSFYRSLQTGTGSFVIQNVSGDTLSRDPEKLLRASAFEGAFFIYRLWQPDAEAAWIEVHGTLTVDDVGVDTLTFKAMNLLNPSQDDTPLEIYCETCQIQWAGPRCGSTQSTECSYSFQSCQVVERIMVAMNDYEKNYGEATANTALNVINRRRKI